MQKYIVTDIIDDSFPIRQDIEILGPDIPRLTAFDHDEVVITSKKEIRRKSTILGWTVTEAIGVSVINPKAIAKARLNNE